MSNAQVGNTFQWSFSMIVDRIKTTELRNRIEPFLHDQLNQSDYAVEYVDSRKLLSWNRFDLGFKLFYLDLEDSDGDLARRVYKEDIRSQTLGNFCEYGNEDKTSFDSYLKTFHCIYSNMKRYGFSETETIVPLSRSKTIVNGAHRVASAIHQGKTVKAAYLNLSPMVRDYRYFYNRNVPMEILDRVAAKFIEYSNDTYVAFVWPAWRNSKVTTEELFPKTVYKREIVINENGTSDLLDALEKQTGRSVDNKKLTVIFFQANTQESVQELKKEVREMNGMESISIHIMDSHEDAIMFSELIINENRERLFDRFKQRVLYFGFRARYRVAQLLNKIGLYDFFREGLR